MREVRTFHAEHLGVRFRHASTAREPCEFRYRVNASKLTVYGLPAPVGRSISRRTTPSPSPLPSSHPPICSSPRLVTRCRTPVVPPSLVDALPSRSLPPMSSCARFRPVLLRVSRTVESEHTRKARDEGIAVVDCTLGEYFRSPSHPAHADESHSVGRSVAMG